MSEGEKRENLWREAVGSTVSGGQIRPLSGGCTREKLFSPKYTVFSIFNFLGPYFKFFYAW